MATTIDLFNREVIGYAMAEHMRADLVCRAVAREQVIEPAGIVLQRTRGRRTEIGAGVLRPHLDCFTAAATAHEERFVSQV